MAGFHLDDSQALTWLPFLLLSLFHSAGSSALPEHPIEMSSPLRSLTTLPYLCPYLYSMALSLRFIFKFYLCVCVCLHNLEQSTGTPGAGVTGQCGLPNVGGGNCTSQEQRMLFSLQQLFLDLLAYINLQLPQLSSPSSIFPSQYHCQGRHKKFQVGSSFEQTLLNISHILLLMKIKLYPIEANQ